MNNSRRLILYLLFLISLAILGFVFRSFLIANLAGPAALVFWLILRLLLAVDQKVYWVLLILFAFFQAVRHIPQTPGTYSRYPQAESRSALENVKNWRAFITLTSQPGEIGRHNLLRQNLIDLLISIYASDQEDDPAAFDIYDSLKQRKIPLPDPVYQFLFLEALVPRNPLSKAWQNIHLASQKWIRRWRGQEVAGYYQSIEAVLSFMETTLEISHDHPPTEGYPH